MLVLVVLGYGFGRAIARGYYFGGCDEVAHSRHYITHVFGFKMCRDENIPPEEEARQSQVQTSEPSALKHEYASPCDLYVEGHNARLEITGSEAVSDCERFVAASKAPWTTEAHPSTEALDVVCEVTNHNQEHAVVSDTGGREYGSAACTQLSGEGWG